MEGAADAGSSDIDRTAFKMVTVMNYIDAE